MTKRLMKDGLNAQALNRIGVALTQVKANIDIDLFMTTASNGLDQLELKERVDHIIAALHRVLPSRFKETAAILSAIPPIWDTGDPADPYRGFAAWPLIDYVGVYGLDHPNAALDALEGLTQMFSAEFAIRPFLIHCFGVTYDRLASWCDHPNEHVRRLVSEGTRPRLPWGKRVPRLIDDPGPGLTLLAKLNDDPSLTVRRSVANHLNDISKDHPETVVDLCRQWSPGADPNRKWLIKHALRTLIKDGHPGVFTLLGFDHSDGITVSGLTIKTPDVELGSELVFSFKVVNSDSRPKKIVLDYAIQFVRSHGKTTRKVFKLRNLTLIGNGTKTIDKRHSFRPITTRKYYRGKHTLEITLNGISVADGQFNLV